MAEDNQNSASRALAIFTTRLETLARLLDLAAKQWREQKRDPETLRSVRLAEDMFPLTHQVVFTCNQPHEFVTWCTDGEVPKPDPSAMAFADLRPHVEATLTRLAATAPQITSALMPREKRIDLMHGMFVVLSGQDYVDDWLLPNFYFHLVTAYDLLRLNGRADWQGRLHGAFARAGATSGEPRTFFDPQTT